MSDTDRVSRRTLLKTAFIAAPITVPMVVAGCGSTRGTAQASQDGVAPLVKTSDPVALAVAYYANTRDVDADNPLAANHTDDQKCANCVHRRSNAAPDRIICGTFPGRTVSPEGWCSIWAQGKPG